MLLCKRLTAFQITRNGNPITQVNLKHSINTGIDFGNWAGCIPLFQEIAACNAANYTYFHSWQELSTEQRAFIVAQHLLEVIVNNHQQDAEMETVNK